jgi:Domain of unknown function (DUF4350)
MPARVGTSDLTILIASGVAMAALTIVSVLLAPADSSPQVPGSSYSTEPDGVKAAYLVIKDLGHDVWRSFEPITSLRSTPAASALVLSNPRLRPSQGDRQALESFVRAGGIVIAFGLAAEAFLPGVTPNPHRRRDAPVEVFRAALPGRLTHHTRELSAHRTPLPALDPSYVTVYGDGDNPAVVTARFGEGQVIWCFDETLLQNEGITRGMNINFIANAVGAAGARTIAWDEYYHGARRSFWSYVAGTPLVWGVAQSGVIALTLLAGVSRRRGPLRPRPIEPRTSPLEFVDTMASLYERAGDARSAVQSTRDRLRRRLAMISGLPISSSDEQLAAIGAPRIGLDAERLRAALAAGADALRGGVARDSDALAIVAELQDLGAAASAARAGSKRQQS